MPPRFVHCFRHPALFATYQYIAILVLCVTALGGVLSAQPRSPLSPLNAKGKEFYLAFPPNQYAGILAIYIIADTPTQGEIIFGNTERRAFSITNPDIAAVFEYSSAYSLYSFEEQPVLRSFYVRADNDVSVYALNSSDNSSDAFMVMPVRSLGKKYFVASFPSINFFGEPWLRRNDRTPSQFSITAAFDNTEIVIRPSVPTAVSLTSATQRIVLQRGESYLVRARMYEEDKGNSDLTGTKIESTKPIVVLGSHTRTHVPKERYGARDWLGEQMPSVETLGTEAIIIPTPLFFIPDTTGVYADDPINRDRYRVIATLDSTVVMRNGREVAHLSSGQVYEDSVYIDAIRIQANHSILVVGYRGSDHLSAATRYSRNSSDVDGDPFMVIFPPIINFLPAYRFCTLRATQGRGATGIPDTSFRRHFVSITIPTRHIPSLRLNAAPITNATFRPVTNSSYSFASVEIASGTYTLTADTTFCAIVSGYGYANSYGYAAGYGLEIDQKPPQIISRTTCGRVLGTIYDSSQTDSKLFWVNDSARQNVRVDIAPISRPADSIQFRAELLNPLLDGSVLVTAIDSVNRLTRQRIFIPGFTVQSSLAPTLGRPEPVPFTRATVSVPTGIRRCFSVPIVNYGSTQQTFTVMPFAATSAFRVASPQTMTLRPQSSTSLTVCVETAFSGVFSDTLRLSNGCFERDILSFRVQAAPDTLAPIVQQQRSPLCNQIHYSLSDSGRFDSGILRIVMDTLTNCVALPNSRNSDGTFNQIFEITNLRRDAIIGFSVQDFAGNIRLLRDTVQTLSVEFITTSASISVNNGQTILRPYSFPITVIGNITCQTLSLYNTSSKPFTLNPEDIQLANNVVFSMPPSQFPLIIPPKAIQPLLLCFAPRQSEQTNDTLLISRSCLSDGIIAMGIGTANILQGQSRCNVDVILRQNTTNRERIITTLYPHPANTIVTLNVLLQKASTLTLRVHTSLGAIVFSRPNQRYEAGEHQIDIDTSSLAAGVYVCEVMTEDYRQTILIQITK